MRVRFWGTRGSIPVALSGAGVRQKIKRALCKANGRHFESETAIERFIEAKLDFPTRDTGLDHRAGHFRPLRIVG
jgi:hypothetical protein